ncbi:6-phosphogluconolactonase [Nakamurella sp. UYEF19]|uniref:lactonase family protein n=1 Tax=Nakamurella sp. UYEF19 TaxID=1756392 RepID=UPI003390A073
MIYVAGEGIAGEGGGVSVFTVSAPGDFRLVAKVPVDEMLYLAVDPSGRYLYGVSGVSVGYVHVWRIGGPGVELTRVGVPVHSGGGEPCHVVVDDSGDFLLVANYHGSEVGSVAVLPISPDGSLSTVTAVSRSTVPGPVAGRQGESHIHQVIVGPENEVLVVDLGADQVVSYVLVDGALVDPVVSHGPPGSGPRHLVRLPDGRVVVTGELDSTLLRARHVNRRLVDWQATPSSGSPSVAGEPNYPSDLRVGGSFVVHVANRGADTVATLSIATGAILRETPCGAWPRHLALDGDLLYVSATRANRVMVLDTQDRMAEPRSFAVAGPMCVVIT